MHSPLLCTTEVRYILFFTGGEGVMIKIRIKIKLLAGDVCVLFFFFHKFREAKRNPV